ncbi:hypothetical protein [Tichowtungia aerotolerans]|uniref:Uncharacterized protein n=1 Tax=Tichowtungia aerotolerans TaxID=2697043 RepID=A0A6P1M5N4_9BACT|nr:hypothetical protein [Tichowtungia aerotolerans]QHI69151.1 hypothetical protein GT409_06705 [Tichowtungia aerotolerans]
MQPTRSRACFGVRQLLSLVALTAGCAVGAQLQADRFFQDGVNLLAPVGGAVEGRLLYQDSYDETVWSLAQWGSRGTLWGTEPYRLPSGATVWSNAFKHVVFGPLTHSDGNVVLAVNAINEYGGVYRQSGESWPALLISQSISNPKGWFKEYGPWISDLSEVIVDIELNLRYANHIYTTGYSESLHAAQFLLYFTIQNLRLPRDTNPDYGNYLWLGLRFYDDRETLPGLSVNHDIGTGKLIYNIGIEPFTDEGLQVGEWKRIKGDLLPHIKAGLQEAWSRGYLTNSFDLADYKIGGMNMGWEVPGLSDVAMQVRNFSVQAYGLDFARPFEFNKDGDAEGWTYSRLTQLNNGPYNGRWIFKVPGDDPQLIGPALRLNAERYQSVLFGIANAGNPIDGSVATLFWKREGDADFSTNRSVSVAVGNGGGWQIKEFDLSAHPQWTGEIVQLRFDPVAYGDDHAIGVDFIRPISAAAIAQGDAPDIQMKNDMLYWVGAPYQQYTLQVSTNLSENSWTDAENAVNLPWSDSVMFHPLAATNRPARAFYRLQVSPGP